MTVRHLHFDPHLLLPRHRVKTLLVAIERVVDVVRAVHKEDRHAAAREQAAGIVGLHPGVTTVAEFVDARLLHRFPFVKKAAAIYRHCGFEARVERRHEARRIAAPTNPGDRSAFRVHFGKGAQQRVRADHRSGGVKWPIVRSRPTDRVELFGMPVLWPPLGESRPQLRIVR